MQYLEGFSNIFFATFDLYVYMLKMSHGYVAGKIIELLCIVESTKGQRNARETSYFSNR